MKKEKNKFVFANGDSMNPVFATDGTELFDSESVKRKIEELEDEIRVTKGHANIAYALNSLYEEDKKKQKRKRCMAMAEMCNARYDAEDAKVNDGISWEYISKEMKYW